MASAARLSAIVSVALGFALVISIPTSGGSGLAALVGWIGLLILVIGMLTGLHGSVTVAALAFVLQLVIVAGLPVGLALPLWLQTLLIVLVVEFADASLSYRDHASDLIVSIGRALGIAITASVMVQVMSTLLAGSDASGALLRAAGVGALAIAGGWVVTSWRRSVLAPGRGSVESDR